MVKGYNDNVFINCPFDDEYNELFYATVFVIFDCGFIARCSLEEEDSGQVRIDKIQAIIKKCKYGIHDISRTALCKDNELPRFNMPLELGLFLGARKFGVDEQKKKRCLVLDTEKYRYQMFMSDIAGQDIRAHNNDAKKLISEIRKWLRVTSQRTTLPGGSAIWKRYQKFRKALPDLCSESSIEFDELTFNDYSTFVSTWLRTL